MKKTLSLATALLIAFGLIPRLALATVTIPDSGSNATGTITGASACSIGDLIFVALHASTNGAVTFTITNTSGVTNFGAYNTGGTYTTTIGYAICNSTGTPVISTSGATAVEILFERIHGFVHTATVLTGDTNTGSATSTALNSGNVVASQNNEYFFGLTNQGGQGVSVGSTQFSYVVGDNSMESSQLATTTVSSGTTVNLSATLNASVTWRVVIIGFYDGTGGSSCSNSGYSITGAWVVPNGSSGSYYGQSGNWVTPNCSSTSYYQQSGAFGVN